MGLDVTAAAFNPADAEAYLKRGASRVFFSEQAELKDFEASVYAQALAQIARKEAANDFSRQCLRNRMQYLPFLRKELFRMPRRQRHTVLGHGSSAGKAMPSL